MAKNIEQKTIDIIQILIRDAFNMNSVLDRVKSILTTELAFPITGNLVHMLAHKYPIQIADALGDIIENRNQPVNYGGIPVHEEMYMSVAEAINKVHDSVIIYQNELNKGAKDVLMGTYDMDAYNGIMEVIEEHKKYVDQVILWKDIVDRYEGSSSLDVHMVKYDILGLGA
jgi:hypothetical protein